MLRRNRHEVSVSKSRPRDAVSECLGHGSVSRKSGKVSVSVSSRRKDEGLGLVSVSGLSVSLHKLIFNDISSLTLVSDPKSKVSVSKKMLEGLGLGLGLVLESKSNVSVSDRNYSFTCNSLKRSAPSQSDNLTYRPIQRSARTGERCERM